MNDALATAGTGYGDQSLIADALCFAEGYYSDLATLLLTPPADEGEERRLMQKARLECARATMFVAVASRLAAITEATSNGKLCPLGIKEALADFASVFTLIGGAERYSDLDDLRVIPLNEIVGKVFAPDCQEWLREGLTYDGVSYDAE